MATKEQTKTAKKLQLMLATKDELQKELKTIEASIEESKQKLLEELGTGNFIMNDFVICLDVKERKGRVTTSWKNVSEESAMNVSTLVSSYGIKYPECASILNRFGKNFDKRYEDSLTNNTKDGKPSKSINVDFKPLS